MEFEGDQGKLEETVIQILKDADLEIATELVVRREAERQLGVDLSDIASKRLVRRVVESFLLSTSPVNEVGERTEQVEKSPIDNRKVASDDGGGHVICKLPGMMRVSVRRFKRTKLLSIREYYQKEETVFAFGRGITLNSKEWSAFCSSFDDIEEGVRKMESRIRLESIEKKQSGLNGEAEKVQTFRLVPIATTRLTGRNYYCWRRQMELFLKQLKVCYVLIEPCPRLGSSPSSLWRAQKWMNDDYMCRHSIMSSLSDQLFDQFSMKRLNARETWEELRSLYDDDFGTKISFVNNYMQFEMVDGVSVVEQVEELHRIAGGITRCGIHIDDKFHVGAIVSKLPPSWKHVREKLLQEEYLPLDKLIYRLKEEEDFQTKRRGLCFACRQEGHIRRDCPFNRP